MKQFLKDKKIIMLLIFSILFITLSLLVVTNKTNNLDVLTHSYILKIRSSNLTKFLIMITNFANATFLLALSTILLIIMKEKKKALFILINLICAFLTNETAKSIFTRSRPIGINLIEETGLSFPSGHSMVSLSFYGFIIYLIHKSNLSKPKKNIISITLIILILIIGFSRIYLGVHYLTDIIGGFLLAIIYITLFIRIINIEKK